MLISETHVKEKLLLFFPQHKLQLYLRDIFNNININNIDNL